jgi:hypothetical protein
MSFVKFKQALLYLGLTFSFLFASVSVSNADPFNFTVTAEVCDPFDPDQHTPGSLTEVSVASGSSLDLGKVEAGDEEYIDFDITASNPTDCSEFDLGPDPIDISFSDDANFGVDGDNCDTGYSACAVIIYIPSSTTTLNETITFSYTP